ncbi:MAG: hypothetical protein GF418_12845 [Chitinivibrionales bacterium]|nr:hypothetical protein [Chitinivibrionales bacterium]MBD3396506.1 hypothetical protein [Chitinivibrionales bacterium]
MVRRSRKTVGAAVLCGAVGLVLVCLIFRKRRRDAVDAEREIEQVAEEIETQLTEAAARAEKQLGDLMTNSKGRWRRTDIEQAALRAKSRLAKASRTATEKLNEVLQLSENDYIGI